MISNAICMYCSWGVQIPLEKKVTSTSTSSTTSSPTSSHTTTTTTTAAAAGGGGSSNNNNNTNTVVSYEIILELPTGTHFYKFCVDGAWKYDPEVAFAQDEYGNINNFITIYPFIDQETKQKSIQKPIRTIIRHGSNELPTMNPIATEELLKIRSKTTTSPILKGAFAKRSSQQQQQQQPSSPKPLALEKALSVCTLREPSETQDLEYGLNIRGKHHSHHSTGEITSRSSRSSSSNSTRAGGGGGEGGRSRTNTLTRSKSEESLCSGTFLEDHLLSSPSSSSSPLRPPSPHTKTASKYARYVQDSISSSILLAATTQVLSICVIFPNVYVILSNFVKYICIYTTGTIIIYDSILVVI
jgi:hypothetical protein